MTVTPRAWLPAAALLACAALLPFSRAGCVELKAETEALLRELGEVHGLTAGQMERIREIFSRSPYLGQGNPAITRHPATPEQCEARLTELGVRYDSAEDTRICGAPNMAPLYDPLTEKPDDATACIDRFEFPDIPCRYPVVWVRAREAAEICAAMDKHLCDAHQWEGACAGALKEPDYRFDLAANVAPETAIKKMRAAHNRKHEAGKSWAYGPAYERGICAAASEKSPLCAGGGWASCGSNTYPSGMFPGCRSALGVYDQHGNAAEHMNLPLSEAQMASRGSRELGYTEMKGSWFIFDRYHAHEDWCRWRAPYWHGSRVMSPGSHHNYHLGFRCCSRLAKPAR